MILNGQEKPPLEELSHFGVKGMRWGVRRNSPTGGQIREARQKVSAQAKQIRDKKKEVRQTTEKGSKERARGEQKVSKMTRDYLNNPDRATAARLTRGEKTALLLLASPTVAGLAGAGAAIGISSANRRMIEIRQQRGFYNSRKRKF